MSDKTKIEWADATYNPVTGCAEVSSGCDHCYAKTFSERWRDIPGHYFENGFDVTLRPDKLTLPLKWKTPRRVFVNSMSDLFHKDIPDAYIAQVFAVMAVTPQHSYMVLTKRHGRMRSLLRSGAFAELVWLSIKRDFAPTLLGSEPMGDLIDHFVSRRAHGAPMRPLGNMMLGVSTENQHWADIRIPALLDTPAAQRFISAEPLLGPIDLAGPLVDGCHRPRLTYWLTGRPHWGPEQRDERGNVFQEPAVGPKLDLVICGAESGPGARPMDLDWVRLMRDECVEQGVAFFFKQDALNGKKIPTPELDGKVWVEMPRVPETAGAR